MLPLFCVDMLQKYNPQLRGFSTGEGGQSSSEAMLNVANPHAKSR